MLFTISWEQRKLGEIANRFDNLRVPVAENLRKKGNTPYYGANGIQDYVEGFTHNGEFVLIAEDGANDLENYPVQYINGKIWVNNHAHVLQSNANNNTRFMKYLINHSDISNVIVGGSRAKLNSEALMNFEISTTTKDEQEKISLIFSNLDSLITLHQSKQRNKSGGKMKNNKKELLSDYLEKWIKIYKEGAIRDVTMKKYKLTLSWVIKLAPKLKLCDVDRITYQQLLNDYAKEHERQTVMDFHHQLKSAVLDAVDEGLIERDPTRKVIIKGKTPTEKKKKYLNQFELHLLIKDLKLDNEINYDWLLLLIAKTGMRFSEAIALTPADFDFTHQTLSISKTWNYKGDGGFQPTKNKSSVRKIQIDWMIISQFSALVKDLPSDKPIFIMKDKIYNSTLNDILNRHCRNVNVPEISVHGLRHTHASLLLFAGVSIASVAKRLGHSSMNTTEKTYLHIIRELENKDVDLVMRSLSGLC